MKNTPTILAIETATDACSCALLLPNGNVIEKIAHIPRAHTQIIFPMITEILEEASITLPEISAIAVGRGPGSFTGVRIAVSVAQGLAFGLQLPVYPISTLMALAQLAKIQVPEAKIIIPALDARMQEVYSAAYDATGDVLVAISPEQVGAPAPISTHYEHVCVIGSGWDAYPPISEHRWLQHCAPSAKYIALLAVQAIQQGTPGIAAETLQPVYVRDNVADKMAS